MSSGEHTIAREDEGEGWYDPELLFLAALERDVRRHARHVAASRQRRHSMHEHRGATGQNVSHIEHDEHAARRRLRPAGGRIARRSLTLLALLSLIGASAFGAGRFFSGTPASDPAAVSQSAFVTLATGAFGSERWSLRVYIRGNELCRVLSVSETESSRCSAAFASRALGATSALGSSRRYLFGLTGAAIKSLSIHGDGSSTHVQTQPLPTIATKAAHMPAGERWYLTVLARPVGEPDPPVQVQGLDRAGRPTGVAVLDCPETGEPSRCQH